MTKQLRYCLQTADRTHLHEHPVNVMKNLGITYQHRTPQSMSAEWWFWNCENIPDKLPDYLREVDINPMECVGYGLSQKDAENIRDYQKAEKKDA